ncbi:PBSX family phage terminase large subunit [Streptomyces malaysiensis subsp. malaysiensis]|uniref:PBSX family phage terminase large subunit n=1 Tax=Streptomyces malaysiensis TaxID=92644 RepID=UPI000BFB28F2|nr:PBSX family phage terminase large subunit [Streptomyces malaysiensis]ATL86684.1 phage terminase, large subunit, PBSX family [Streptomyces malaysiensis]QDL69783.1 PBSX family phage terminase large subunit [Streptomyces malaysiensis]
MLNLDRLPLSRKQLRSIGQATRRINLWHGSVRSGKTIASLLAFVIAAAGAGPSGLIIICGRSLQTIERNVLEPLQDHALFGPLARHVVHTRGATTATILGRTVHLIGAADARAEGRLRGLTAQLAYVDEATLLPEGFWTQLLARLSVPGARLYATTNPDSPRHWLKTGYIDRAAELNLRAWHFKLADNPSLSPEYVADLAAEYVGLWRRRMIDGAWVVAEGAIYDMWDEGRHVVDQLPDMRRYWLGCDYGTTNPFSAILLGEGVDDRLYVAAEWRHDSRATHRSMTDAQYSAAVRKWLDGLGIVPEWTFVDPSAASFSTQLWQGGHPGLARASNEVADGIRSVSSLLAAGRLLVHESCEGLLNELPGYSWDPKATERGEDSPLKVDDHSVDALRYVVHSTAHEWRHPLTTSTCAVELG